MDLDLHIFEIISKIIDLDVRIIDLELQLKDLDIQIYDFEIISKIRRSKSCPFVTGQKMEATNGVTMLQACIILFQSGIILFQGCIILLQTFITPELLTPRVHENTSINILER